MSDVFQGGIPYSIDVKRLTDAFPVDSLVEGRVIEHEELAKIIMTPKGSQRYYSVINCWIVKMRDANGVFIVWKPSIGVEVLDPAGVQGYAETRTRQKFRQTGRAIKLHGYVDRERLNRIGQERYDHNKRVLTIFEGAMHTAQKKLPVALGPVESLPKRELDVKNEKNGEHGNEQNKDRGTENERAGSGERGPG